MADTSASLAAGLSFPLGTQPVGGLRPSEHLIIGRPPKADVLLPPPLVDLVYIVDDDGAIITADGGYPIEDL